MEVHILCKFQLCMSGVPALLGVCPLPKSDRCAHNGVFVFCYGFLQLLNIVVFCCTYMYVVTRMK